MQLYKNLQKNPEPKLKNVENHVLRYWPKRIKNIKLSEIFIKMFFLAEFYIKYEKKSL
jgi:hypothetical protein